MKSYKNYSIDNIHQGFTVESYLKDVLQISGRKIQKLTRQKGILLNQKNVFLQKKMKTGDTISVLVMEDQSYGVIPESGELDILYEDDQVVIINKPINILVHPAGQTTSGTLANYLAEYFQQKGEILTIRPLHRLDRDTTGCVAFVKNAQAQAQLEKQIQSGQCKRTYYTIVIGNVEPPSGTINAPIGPHPSKPNRRAIRKNGEIAITHYQTIKTFHGLSLLTLNLETGRTHQIRVHLAHIGHPILGDKMYGKSSPLISRQALHAESLRFMHPINQKVILVKAPLPTDMEMLLKKGEEES